MRPQVQQAIQKAEETIARSKQLESALSATLSERKAAQTELRESQRRFRLIAESLNEVLWLSDSERKKILYISPQCERVFGMAPSLFEKDPRCFLSQVHPDDRDAVEFAFSSASPEGTELEFRIKAPDGSWRWLSEKRLPVRSEDGAISLVGITEDITDKKTAEERLQEAYADLENKVHLRTKDLERANEDIRRLANHLDCVREEENRRIAQEIHDVVGQTLTVAKMKLAVLQGQSEKVKPDDLRSLGDLLSRTADDVRRISQNLRPTILDHFGIQAALEWMSENFQQTAGLPVVVKSDRDGFQLSSDTSIAVFRICQEALNNAAKHSHAKKVEIRLRDQEGRVVVEIEDDGVGFISDQTAQHSLGLLGMHERALRLGGEIRVESAPGKGTIVRLEIPHEDKQAQGACSS